MNTANIDRIRLLGENAAGLRHFWRSYRERVALPCVDKYGAGFNHDHRWTIFGGSIEFGAHTGVKGNSGCVVFGGRLDRELCSDLLVKALNEHREQIFQTMADLAEAERSALLTSARAEVAAIRSMLDEVEAPDSSQSDDVTDPSQAEGL